MLMDPVDGPILASLLGIQILPNQHTQRSTPGLPQSIPQGRLISRVDHGPPGLDSGTPDLHTGNTDWALTPLPQLVLVLWSTPKLRRQTTSGRTPQPMSSSSGIASTAATVGRIHPPDDPPWSDSPQLKPQL